MSIQVANTALIPLNLGTGQQLQVVRIADCTPLKNDPSVVPLIIKWTNYGAITGSSVTIDANMDAMGAGNTLDALRSIQIDNSFSDVAVYAVCPDTGFTVLCPPNSVCISPLWTHGRRLILYCNNFPINIPQTTFIFSNVHVNEFSVVSSTPVLQKIILQTAAQIYNSGGGTNTFNNVDFGLFFANGVQYICVEYNINLGDSTLVVTANGNACAEIIHGAAVFSGNQWENASIFKVPINLSGQKVTIALTGISNSSSFQIISTNNLVSGNANSVFSGDLPQVQVTPVNGLAIMCFTSQAVQTYSGLKNFNNYAQGVLNATVDIRNTVGSSINVSKLSASGTPFVMAGITLF